MDRIEGRRGLDLRIHLAQRVTAGKDLFAAALVRRTDGHRDVVEDAAGGALVRNGTGRDLDLVGTVIALDETVEILSRLCVAVIPPGAGEFVPVDGAVER